MGLIKDKDRYPDDNSISNEDFLIGTDAEDSDITKSFKVSDLIAFISTQISGTSQDNLFQEVDLGFMYEDESISSLANALPSYTVTESGLAIYKVTINPTSADGEDRVLTYITLLKGKGTYGVGGTVLNDSDFFNINPIQLETVRNSLVIESLISTNKILSGDTTWTGAGLVFESTDYSYVISGQIYSADANSSITLDVGDADPRIDVIALNTSGVFVVIRGTAAPSPIKPSLTDFDTQIEVTNINVGALATTPTGIAQELIYNENLGEPNEWVMTDNTGGARIVFNSTSNPHLGALSIFGTGMLDGDSFTATNATTVAWANYSQLALNIKTDSRLRRGFNITITPYNGGTQAAASVTLSNGAFGLRVGQIISYQTIIIPISAFFWEDDNFDKLTFTFNNPNVSDAIHIDTIRLVSGIFPSNLAEIPTNTSDLVNDGEDGINPFITANDLDNIYNIDGTVTASENRLITLGASASIRFQNAATTSYISLTDAGNFFVKALVDFNIGTVSGNNNINATEGGILSILGADAGIKLRPGSSTVFDTIEVGSVATASSTEGKLLWSPKMIITEGTGALKLESYGNGTFTGTTAYTIDSDSSGNLIESLKVLEIINEGNGNGIVQANRTAANFGNVGLNAKDFSISTGASSTIGATGEQSVSFAEDSVASGFGAFAGTGFLLDLTGTFTVGFGFDNESNGYSSAIFGSFNTELTSTGYSFTAGQGNVVNHNAGFASGVALLKGIGVGSFVAGTANVDIVSANNGTDVNAPMFIFGNGTHTTGAGVIWTSISRSNLLVGLRNGEITAPSTTIAVIDGESTGKILITKEWIVADYVPYTGATTDVDLGLFDIKATLVNDLELFAQIGVDVDNIGIGVNTLSSNTGSNVIGIGTSALENNTGVTVIGIGQNAGENNTNFVGIFIGDRAGQNNTGGSVIAIGQLAGWGNTGDDVFLYGNNSGQYNSGLGLTGIGKEASKYNKGDDITSLGSGAFLKNSGNSSIGIGGSAGLQNTGDDVVIIGVSSGTYNEGNTNTIVGKESSNIFNDDVSNLKNVADATTDIDLVNDRITITAHGFGATSSYKNLKYTTTGTPITGLTVELIYKVLIFDANTIEFIDGIDLSTNGTDTHTFTPQFVYNNITVLGANVEPTKSNQVTLGDENVIEVYTDGHIKTHKEVIVDTSTTYNFVIGDRNSIITLDNAASVSAIIPANSSVPYPIGTSITIINKGAGIVTISITTDTLNQNVGGLTLAQYDKRTIVKITATEWILGY